MRFVCWCPMDGGFARRSLPEGRGGGAEGKVGRVSIHGRRGSKVVVYVGWARMGVILGSVLQYLLCVWVRDGCLMISLVHRVLLDEKWWRTSLRYVLVPKVKVGE